jgi:hypothetical protein
VCYRVIWFLHKAHIRLGAKLFLAVNLEPKLVAEYSWQELWSALIGLLAFLSSKLDNLMTTGGVEQLARAVSAFGTALVSQYNIFLRQFFCSTCVSQNARCSCRHRRPSINLWYVKARWTFLN